MAKLIVIEGPNIGQEFVLSQTNSIGSGEANAIRVHDPDVSAYHAQLTRIKNRYYIVNLTVDNSILVNRKEVEKIMLTNGDTIKIGNTVFLFSDEEIPENDETSELSSEEHTSEGRDFGKYTILEEISRGENTVVYKAIQKGLDRIVALKVLITGEDSSSEQVARFLGEARAIAKLDHPNIVPIFDIGYFDKKHYFAMEYIEGKSLDELLKEKKVDSRKALVFIAEIANALHYAHERGIIHRDIKPSNIIIDKYGKAMLTDFGVAKEVYTSTHMTRTGTAIGTPMYMSPEQAAGKPVDRRTDIYSLGAVMYEIFTGRPPYSGDNQISILMQVISTEAPEPKKLNPRIHPDINTIITKAMERDIERRYQTAAELEKDIRSFLKGEAISARPISKFSRLYAKIKKHRLVISVIAIALVSMISSFIFITKLSREAIQVKKRISLTESKLKKQKLIVMTEKKPRWKKIYDINKGNINLLTLTGMNLSFHNNKYILEVHTSGECKFIKRLYGNIEINFEIDILNPKNLFVSFFLGEDRNNSYRFIFGKWEKLEFLLIKSGNVVARQSIESNIEDLLHLNINLIRKGISLIVTVSTGKKEFILDYADINIIPFLKEYYFGIWVKDTSLLINNLSIKKEFMPLRTDPVEMANRLLFSGNISEALKGYDEVFKVYPGKLEIKAAFYAGIAYELLGNYKRALRMYQRVLKKIKLNPKLEEDFLSLERDTWIRQFFCYSHLGNYMNAIKTISNLPKEFYTPYRWRIVNVIEKMVNIRNFVGVIELLKYIKYSSQNILFAEVLENFIRKIEYSSPRLIPTIYELCPYSFIEEYLYKVLEKVDPKEREEILKFVINHHILFNQKYSSIIMETILNIIKKEPQNVERYIEFFPIEIRENFKNYMVDNLLHQETLEYSLINELKKYIDFSQYNKLLIKYLNSKNFDLEYLPFILRELLNVQSSQIDDVFGLLVEKLKKYEELYGIDKIKVELTSSYSALIWGDMLSEIGKYDKAQKVYESISTSNLLPEIFIRYALLDIIKKEREEVLIWIERLTDVRSERWKKIGLFILDPNMVAEEIEEYFSEEERYFYYFILMLKAYITDKMGDFEKYLSDSLEVNYKRKWPYYVLKNISQIKTPEEEFSF